MAIRKGEAASAAMVGGRQVNDAFTTRGIAWPRILALHGKGSIVYAIGMFIDKNESADGENNVSRLLVDTEPRFGQPITTGKSLAHGIAAHARSSLTADDHCGLVGWTPEDGSVLTYVRKKRAGSDIDVRVIISGGR